MSIYGTIIPALDVGNANGTGAIQLPIGNTAQRPANPTVGMIRYNTDSNTTEVFNGITWAVPGKLNVISSGLILQLDNSSASYPGSGSTWFDISGNSNNFTLQGNLTWAPATGFSNFNGNGSGNGNKIYRNNFPQNLKTSQGGNGYTVMVVANSTGGAGAWRKLIGNNDGENYMDLYQNASSPYAWHQDGSGDTLYYNAGISVANDTLTMDDSVYRLYIATNANNGDLSNPTGPLTIGNEPNSGTGNAGTNAYPWVGNIVAVYLYNRVLATSEMATNYNIIRANLGLI